MVSHATPKQQKNELWDVSGIIKGRSNQQFKFDLRPMTRQGDDIGKIGKTDTKADKMVFEFKDKFIIVDLPELHKYIKENKLQKVYLQDLISKLDWNIILPK